MELTLIDDSGNVQFLATRDSRTGYTTLKIDKNHGITANDYKLTRFVTAEIQRQLENSFSNTATKETIYEESVVTEEDLNF